ncbi:hypothetical protein HII31_09260 [Pseudocercospora fuligena]|uniref:Uncharacterized protein n=1 Tax=Pseudocercospora fuligena TaxID=685502 RepID=A0A8H6VFE9_9PEZI|nr:hypothetical protein HII31_09260 [Pseudocercospora fuligena]
MVRAELRANEAMQKLTLHESNSIPRRGVPRGASHVHRAREKHLTITHIFGIVKMLRTAREWDTILKARVGVSATHHHCSSTTNYQLHDPAIRDKSSVVVNQVLAVAYSTTINDGPLAQHGQHVSLSYAVSTALAH